jgi:hypothetical protein
MATERPVDPKPAGLNDDRAEVWYLCTGIVNSHETGDDLKRIALHIREQLRLEAKVNVLIQDVANWVQLAKYQREWFYHNDPKNVDAAPSPKIAAIEASEKLIGRKVGYPAFDGSDGR